MGSGDANKAKSSRRLLFWIVIGIILLNIILFLKFGLIKTANPSPNSNGIAVTNKAPQ